MVDIWREQANVRFGDIDRSKRLTLGSIFAFFQEAALSHAADLGIGLDDFERTGQAWIISRLSLFIGRRPAFGETVQVSTWPRKWEKLFALRDYEIKDAAGIAIVRGRSGWLMVNVEKRRPLRVEPLMNFLPHNDGIDAFPAGFVTLGARENAVKAGERTARYSDIDFYGHMNNARYVQWIQDATNADTLTAADEIRLDINYLSEVRPGETVELWTVPLDETGKGEGENPGDYPRKKGPGFFYEGRRPDSEQAVFRAELRTG